MVSRWGRGLILEQRSGRLWRVSSLVGQASGRHLQWRSVDRRVVLLVILVLFGSLLVDALSLDLQGPTPSYLLLDRHERFIAEIGTSGDADEEYGYWPVETLPPRVVAAALALEDQRFYDHPGVDPLAIGRALFQNVTQGRRVSGASTIAMQVARLLDPGDRTYWRKLREMFRAVALTLRYGRKEVLAAYLRLVPYSNRVRGIGYAARRYLNKPVVDLSWAEIAFLSSIPQAPSRMNPFRENGRQRTIARGLRILQRLQDNAVLSAAEFEIAQQQIRDIRLPPAPVRPLFALHTAFKLKQLLAASPPVNRAEPYRIVSTIDLDLQEQISEMASAAVAQWQSQGAGNAAVILLDRRNSGVLAWVGSTDYFSGEQAGAIDFAATLRSPGSVLKPFIYALALDQGNITSATILDDLPAVGGGIANADDIYLGPMLPRQALANSRNVPAARLLDDIGLDNGYRFLHDLALHNNENDVRLYGLGLVIGAMPVTLERLVQAYSVLANDGQWRSLYWYEGQSGTKRRLLSESTARIVTLHLADVGARLPSFPRMGSTEYAFPVALKTGTSQGVRDAWTVAYSSRYLLGVWVGHQDARPMFQLSGADSAAVLAKRILTQLHGDEQHGLSDLAFPSPQGYRPVMLCGLSGKVATAACDQVFKEWFPPDQVPQEIDDVHVRLAVDVRNGQLAHSKTPARFIERRTFINLPPRYAVWAAQAGLTRPPGEVSQVGTAGSTKWIGARSLPVSVGLLEKSVLRITSPRSGVKVLRDPSVAPAFSTIAFEVEAKPAVTELLWLVDGEPYKLAGYPYAVRWPLQVGDHVIQVRSTQTGETSPAVRIRVE